MPSSYGLVRADYTEKPSWSAVARWNDNIRRHTLFTVCDTLQDIWGLYKGTRPVVSGSTPLKLGSTVPYDAAVGAQASPQLFDWVPVSYPASYIGLTPQITDTFNPKTISLAAMVTWGAADLKARVESTSGTFALVGYGLGAMVCSAILQEMQDSASTLHVRYSDCIAAVMFANACREEGASLPGVPDPGGAGIMPQASTGTRGLIRNTDTPDWWWEMAIADDPVTTCPVDTSGQAINVAADALLKVAGARSFYGQLAKIVTVFRRTSPVWPTVAPRLINKSANTKALAWSERVFALNPSPYNLYSFNTVTANSTYLDTAIAYINQRGTAITPR